MTHVKTIFFFLEKTQVMKTLRRFLRKFEDEIKVDLREICVYITMAQTGFKY